MIRRKKSFTLTELNKGDRARIIKVGGDRTKRRKIFALGILPGEVVILEQKFPVLLLKAGHSNIALDEGVGKNIIVSKENE